MRYSLRTLLILLGAVCCFLAYEMNWVRQRRAIFKTENVFGFFSKTPAPGMLWLFREKGYSSFHVAVPLDATTVNENGERTISASYPLLKRLKALFPEAKVQVGTGGPGTNFRPVNADEEMGIRPIHVTVVE